MFEFLNQPFILTLVGTLAAAFAGAYGAQYIAEVKREKETLLKELRNTNSAITTAFMICNACLTRKNQHIRPLKYNYDQSKKNAIEHQKRVRAGKAQQDEIFEVYADFQALPEVDLPTEILDKKVAEEISANGRALALAIVIKGVSKSLNEAIFQRNALVQEIKHIGTTRPDITLLMYYGFQDPEGNIDNRYHDLVDAIYTYTDDCIYFSKLLCSDLIAHGEQLKEKLGDSNFSIYKPDFEKSIRDNLLPDESKYTDWLSMFTSKEKT